MTIAGILLLALADSVNPSAIVVTLYLLSTAGTRAAGQVLTYVAAIFATYLLLGVVMLLGLETVLPSVSGLLSGRAGFVLQGAIGLALVIYAWRTPAGPAAAPAVTRPSAGTFAALAMLGVTVTVMELPTAIPYLAAIALITDAALPLASWLPLLVVYNLIFVMPPLVLLAGHLLLQDRLAASYAALRQRVESGARETAQWIAGLVGGALLVTAIIELVARLR